MTADSKQQNVLLGECVVKCVNVILSSRLSTQASTPGPLAEAKLNRWFQLEIEDWASVRAGLEQACRGDPATPVEVEVYCCAAGRPEVVLMERWRACLDTNWPLHPQTGTAGMPRSAGSGSSSGGSTGGRLTGEDGALYKRLTLLVRTLSCHLRILPTHRLLRAYKRQPVAVWRLACRVTRGATTVPLPSNSIALQNLPPRSNTSTPQQLQYELSCRWSTVPVPALGGGIRVQVEHIGMDAITALEAMAAGGPAMLAPQRLIINDYLGSNISQQQQPLGRPPLPGTPQQNRGITIPQHDTLLDAMSPSAAGYGTPAVRNSLPRNSSPAAPPSSSPVVRQSWGRKAGGPSPYPPPSPIPMTPIHMEYDEPLPPSLGSQQYTDTTVPSSNPAATKTPSHEGNPAPAGHIHPGASAVTHSPAGHVRQPVYTTRSVSTPPDVAGAAVHLLAAAAATADPLAGASHDSEEPVQGAAGINATAAGSNAPSAPVSIPGGQPRVRSLADIRVVYNFPDNPNHPPSVGATAARARGLASSTTAAASLLVTHTHGSAPAAPRGMLGQALEAHLANLKARAAAPELGVTTNPTTTAQINSAPDANTPAIKAPAPAGTQEVVADAPKGILVPGTSAGDSHGSLRPQRSGSFDSNSTQSMSTSAQQSQVAVPMPRSVTSHHHGRGRHGGSWRGSMAPDSPQLPFAFTPAGHSLGVHGARMLSGTSVPASPSATSLRTPSGTSLPRQQLWQVPGRSSNSTINAVTPAHPAPSSSTVITARDVSALALARRPSWIEHSARTGRSNSTSGEPSPSGDLDGLAAVGRLPSSPSLATQASKQSPAATASSLPTSRLQHLSTSGVTPSHINPNAHASAPSSAVNMGPATCPAALAITRPQQQQAGDACWLQAPQVSTSLSTHAPMMWGEETHGLGQGSLWAAAMSPPELPPLMLVTVPVPDSSGGVASLMEPGSHEDDDLPFLLDSPSSQSQPPEQSAAVGRSGSWVTALKSLCGPSVQPTGSAATTLPGGLHIPARDVAIGMLLAHLQGISPILPPSNTTSDCSQHGTEASMQHGLDRAMQPTSSGSPDSHVNEVAGAAVRGDQLVAGASLDHLQSGDQQGVPVPLTCGAALDQLKQLQGQLEALLSFSAPHM